jgi:hypothetical protein
MGRIRYTLFILFRRWRHNRAYAPIKYRKKKDRAMAFRPANSRD